MCLDHPDNVVRAAILDIIPQHHLLNNVTRQWGTFSWHWFFMIQPTISRAAGWARPDYFIEKKLSKTKQGPELLRSRGACRIPALLPQPRQPSTAMCEDYRATHGVDSTWTTRIRRRRKIACPVLLLWARPAASAATTNRWRSGRAMLPTSGRQALPCGHYLSEEAPEETARELREFFAPDSCAQSRPVLRGAELIMLNGLGNGMVTLHKRGLPYRTTPAWEEGSRMDASLPARAPPSRIVPGTPFSIFRS